MAAGQLIGFTNFQAPSGSVTDDALSANSPAGVTKTRHLHDKGTNFALAIGGTPAAREEIVYTAKAAGTIRNFNALCNDTGTSASVTFDLKKNGTTVLSGVITITNATTDKATQAGSLSSTTYVAGDVFSIALAVSSSTGMTGPYAWAQFDEVAT